jgi:hypothetical protein
MLKFHHDSHFGIVDNLSALQYENLMKHLDSSYDNFLILSTPFHLPNSTNDVFSQKKYYEEGNFLDVVLKNKEDIISMKTKLIFFFVDWWCFCNNKETSGELNGNLVSYDIYKWIYNHLKNIGLLNYAVFSSSINAVDTCVNEEFPIIEYHEPFNRYFSFKDVMVDSDKKTFKKFIFTLNRRPRPHRLYSFYKLFKLGILHDVKYTFHFYDEIMQTADDKINYLNHYLKDWGIDDIDSNILQYCNTSSLDDTYNLEQDNQNLFEAEKLNIESKDCFLEVVNEYNCSNTKTFLTEKVARSIVMRKPFIVLGDRNSLVEIKKMGFKTFDSFWDETYDSLPTAKERIDSAMCTIFELYKTDWQSGYSKELKETIEYNWNHYYNNYYDSEIKKLERIFK